MTEVENSKAKTAKGEGTAKPCVSCKRVVPLSPDKGGRFCQKCLERSREGNLDAMYDDIGGPG